MKAFTVSAFKPKVYLYSICVLMSDIGENSRATIGDVAEQAGVSIATVSRVINQTGQVAEETAARVWVVIEALNYSPHPAARGLATDRKSTRLNSSH